jgi:hypothetical protein
MDARLALDILAGEIAFDPWVAKMLAVAAKLRLERDAVASRKPKAVRRRAARDAWIVEWSLNHGPPC